jgi:hypothetical protein
VGAAVVAKVEILADHRILVLVDQAVAVQEELQTSTVRESQEPPTLVAVVVVLAQMLDQQLVIPIIIVHRVLILNIEEAKAVQEWLLLDTLLQILSQRKLE